MAKNSTLSTKQIRSTKKIEAAQPPVHVLRNILSYSKSLQVKPSVYLGKISHVDN